MSKKASPHTLRDAAFARYNNSVSARDVSSKFDVPGRKVRSLLQDVNEHVEQTKQTDPSLAALMEEERDSKYSATKVVCRWIGKKVGAKSSYGDCFTDDELKDAIHAVLVGDSQLKAAKDKYGITDDACCTCSDAILKSLGKEKAKDVAKDIRTDSLSKKKVREAVDKLQRKMAGKKPILTRTEEAVVVHL